MDQQSVPISFVSIHTPAYVMTRNQCFSLYNSIICMRSSQALKCFQCLYAYPNIWIIFLFFFYRLVDISHRSLCMYLVKIWSFELLIVKDMTLVEHMQNSSPPISLIGCLSHPLDSLVLDIQLTLC